MITEKQKELLQHTLGADGRYMKKQWGFRNHFCSTEGNKDHDELLEMEKLGLVTIGAFGFHCITFFATKQGAIEIGFKKYQLRNTKLT